MRRLCIQRWRWNIIAGVFLRILTKNLLYTLTQKNSFYAHPDQKETRRIHEWRVKGCILKRYFPGYYVSAKKRKVCLGGSSDSARHRCAPVSLPFASPFVALKRENLGIYLTEKRVRCFTDSGSGAWRCERINGSSFQMVVARDRSCRFFLSLTMDELNGGVEAFFSLFRASSFDAHCAPMHNGHDLL